ncbi:winged helix-turn-helix domain-containing protein [Halolamina sp.]|jgi:DNA-binding transcriptional ArsR family regulator|uniref:ArsR/SmtB family transcription factor n=1 Tax=Halolamina sp. TaxID=1940283 RepID=UPI000223BDC1|nr:regulatory protein ArsR [halophilic archaeon DL31]
MSGLLPSESDAVAAEDADDSGGTRLLWLDDDDAETLLGSLSSDTARSVLITLHEEPKTASELADHVDTSLQNVRHHLNSLMEAELVETTDTRYSVKGREMAVYEPVNDSLVLCVGDTEERTSLLSSLRKYIGAAAALVVGSLLVQSTFGLALPGTEGPTSPRVADSVGSSGELLGVVSPGTAFLAGGLVVLLVVALTTYRKTH